MRKSNTQKIFDIIKDSLKDMNIERKMKEVGLVKSWEEVVGKTITRYTRNLYIKDEILFVTLKSSVVRNELYMIKDGLIKALNEKAGEQMIKDIIFK